MLSRAELLLSTGCLTKPALEAAVVAMGNAVRAWSFMEEKEAERRRKEEEILKYKVQDYVVSLLKHEPVDVTDFPQISSVPVCMNVSMWITVVVLAQRSE